MAKCAICKAAPVAGRNVSHSNRKTGRLFRPNLQRARLNLGGKPQRVYICTRCLRTHQNIHLKA